MCCTEGFVRALLHARSGDVRGSVGYILRQIKPLAFEVLGFPNSPNFANTKGPLIRPPSIPRLAMLPEIHISRRLSTPRYPCHVHRL